MDAASLEKLFEPFAAVTIKGMFGGRGVYAEGLMFALQAGDDIYLKTDASSRPRFSEVGSAPFVYRSPMGPKETSYWLMPAEASSDINALKTWCGLALEAARRAAATKGAKGAAVKRAKESPSTKRAPAKPSPARRAGKAAPTGRRPPARKGRAAK
jgi:DNA transformation protein and related proteins